MAIVSKYRVKNRLVGRLIGLGVLVLALAITTGYLPKDLLVTRTNTRAANEELVLSDNLAYPGNLYMDSGNIPKNTSNWGKYVLQTSNKAVVRRLLPQVSGNETVVKVFFYDDMNTVTGSFASLRDSTTESAYNQISIGVRSGVFAKTYFIRAGDNSAGDVDTHFPRSVGWHEFTFVVTPAGSYGMIDGVNTAYIRARDINAPQSYGFTNKMTTANNIVFVSTWTAGNGYFSDLRLYKGYPSAYPGDIQATQYMLDSYMKMYPTTFDNAAFAKYANGTTQTWGGDAVAEATRINIDRALVSGLLFRKTGNAYYKDQMLSAYVAPLNYYPSWLAWKLRYNTPTLSMIYGAWVNWDSLSLGLKSSLYNTISNEMNYMASTMPRSGWGVDGDSAAEENAWTANYLWAAANMFPKSPNARLWLDKAKLFAFHSLTKLGGETDPAGIMKTETLDQNGMIVNHNFINPHYQYVTLGNLANVKQTAIKLGIQNSVDPTWWAHNLNATFATILPYVDFETGLYKGLTMPVNLGGKDDWNLDASSIVNSVYYASQNGLPGYQSAYTNLMKHMWYFDRDFLNLPLGATICHTGNTCDANKISWDKLGDTTTFTTYYKAEGNSGSLWSLYVMEENSVLAAERLGINFIFQDSSITLGKNLDYPANYYDYFAMNTSLPSPTSGRDNISLFLADMGISKYRALRHNPGKAQVTRWNEALNDGKKVNLYFYDDISGTADQTSKGANFGLQFDNNTNGLTVEMRTGTPLDACKVIANKNEVWTKCYLVRAGAQTAYVNDANKGNEVNSGIPRTKGWHKLTYYLEGNNAVMVIDGIFTYKTPMGANPTMFAASSNWNIPTYMEYIITKTDN